MQVLGVPALLARFARTAVAAEVAERVAATAVGIEVAEAAKAQAPVDTGELRDSIEVEPGKVTVGAPYAGFVEFGTAYMAAQPYLRPAADQAEGDGAVAAVREVLGF